MVIYLGADHRGAELKNRVAEFIKNQGYEIADLSPAPQPGDDYPDIAAAVAEKVAAEAETARGIVFCASGAGVDIVANKFKGIRSVLGLNPDQVFDARHDDDANILALAADFENPEEAGKLVQVFIQTPFAGEERFVRRLQKIKAIEERNR